MEANDPTQWRMHDSFWGGLISRFKPSNNGGERLLSLAQLSMALGGAKVGWAGPCCCLAPAFGSRQCYVMHGWPVWRSCNAASLDAVKVRLGPEVPGRPPTWVSSTPRCHMTGFSPSHSGQQTRVYRAVLAMRLGANSTEPA